MRVHPTPDLLAAVAAHGLTGSTRDLPTAPLAADDWEDLLEEVARERLQGHLGSAVATGAFATTDRQREQAADQHMDAMMHVLWLEHRLVQAAALLEGEGIDFRVLKGPAVARSAYPTAGLRVFADIDLLVPTEQFDATVEILLARASCRRRQAALRPDFDRRFGKAVTLIAPDGVEIDVHRTFVMGPFGLTVDLPSLFAVRTTFQLAGREIPMLSAEHRLLQSCYSAVLSDREPRLSTLRDIAQMVLSTPVDLPRVLDEADRSGASGIVALAIETTWDVLGISDVVGLSAWARTYEYTRTERRWVAEYRRDSYGALARSSLEAIHGLANRAAYLRAVLAPSPGFLEEQEHSRGTWLVRGIRRAVAPREGQP